MGIVDRLRRWIDPPQEPAPDDWVILTVVPFHDGPMLQSALEAAGVGAVLQEWTVLPGHLPPRHRVMVQQRELAEATEILADLTAR